MDLSSVATTKAFKLSLFMAIKYTNTPIKTINFSYVHSFGLTSNKLVFIEYPLFWNISQIIDTVTILPSLKYYDDIETKIHIINLQNKNAKIKRVSLSQRSNRIALIIEN